MMEDTHGFVVWTLLWEFLTSFRGNVSRVAFLRNCSWSPSVWARRMKSLEDKGSTCAPRRREMDSIIRITSYPLFVWFTWLMRLWVGLFCVSAFGRNTSKSSRNACVVFKWVLIDALSPFVWLMEKHFSLNCQSQIRAMEHGEQEQGGGGEQVIIIQCERRMEEWLKKEERGENESRRGAEEQAITTISVPFKKLSSRAVWCWNEEESPQEAAGKLA